MCGISSPASVAESSLRLKIVVGWKSSEAASVSSLRGPKLSEFDADAVTSRPWQGHRFHPSLTHVLLLPFIIQRNLSWDTSLILLKSLLGRLRFNWPKKTGNSNINFVSLNFEYFDPWFSLVVICSWSAEEQTRKVNEGGLHLITTVTMFKTILQSNLNYWEICFSPTKTPNSHPSNL